MSRGNGRIQRDCFAALQSKPSGMTTEEVCRKLGVAWGSKKGIQCWKSLHCMAKRGEIINLGRKGWRGAVSWQIPDKSRLVMYSGRIIHRLDELPVEILPKVREWLARWERVLFPPIDYIVLDDNGLVGKYENAMEAQKAVEQGKGRWMFRVLEEFKSPAP